MSQYKSLFSASPIYWTFYTHRKSSVSLIYNTDWNLHNVCMWYCEKRHRRGREREMQHKTDQLKAKERRSGRKNIAPPIEYYHTITCNCLCCDLLWFSNNIMEIKCLKWLNIWTKKRSRESRRGIGRRKASLRHFVPSVRESEASEMVKSQKKRAHETFLHI
jgi:hypothetical protein